MRSKNKRIAPPVSEFTPVAIILGIMLALVMTAANTYLGLYAGMTISASIPAAVISMGILRGVLRRGTILENNIVQTIASTGESLAAGIIFTVPALVLVGAWQEFKFIPTTLIAVFGGLLGVLFMIPLRRALIVEDRDLIYPEGVACAEVLKTGEERGVGLFYILFASIAGMAIKFLITSFGLLKGTLEHAFRVQKSLFYIGTDISLALLGVGYIVGFNIALLVFMGGCIGWLIGIPIFEALSPIRDVDPLARAWDTWSSQIRYMGVGAMLIGGIVSILKVRKGIAKGLGELLSRYRGSSRVEEDEPVLALPPSRFGEEHRIYLARINRSISPRVLLIMLAVVAIFSLVLNVGFTSSLSIGALSTLIMVVAAFFFAAVASYIVGLVGSSNSPVSGMTICALLFTAGILYLAGMRGVEGMLATLGVAGLVCCAACTAGDISQDLKTGHLVQATPRSQQWAEVIGAAIPAVVIAPILTLLHHAYGIGDGTPTALKAPQASLFAGMTQAIFGEGDLPVKMVLIGIGIALALHLGDELLRLKQSNFRLHVMPIAVGIYLPLSLSSPIAIGGLVAFAVHRLAAQRDEAKSKGVLIASGFIAGEAIAGIIAAALIVLGVGLFKPDQPSVLLSLVALAIGCLGLLIASVKVRPNKS